MSACRAGAATSDFPPPLQLNQVGLVILVDDVSAQLVVIDQQVEHPHDEEPF